MKYQDGLERASITCPVCKKSRYLDFIKLGTPNNATNPEDTSMSHSGQIFSKISSNEETILMPNIDVGNGVKQSIEQAIRSFATSVEVPNTSTENDVYHAIRQVMRDNPDIFWFSHQWHYSQENATVRFRYTIDEKHSEKIKAQIEDVVQNDFKLDYVRSLSVKEQVIYVYKWIALYCNYTIHSAHNQTIFSVFIHRHSVCTGIAKAAQYLLRLLGIESRLVFGRMNNSEKDSRHCWLIVNVEGLWYHFDPTFALPETEHLLHQSGVQPAKGDDLLFYNFFCVDTDTIMQSRGIEVHELLPGCSENMDYTILQNINVYPSRMGSRQG